MAARLLSQRRVLNVKRAQAVVTLSTTSLEVLVVSDPVLEPASGASAPLCDQAGEDRKCDLGRIDGAEVQADRALDPGDHILGNALGAKGFEVVAGVPPAANQADECRVPRYHRLQRLHKVGRVMVGVNHVQLLPEIRWQLVQ